MKKAFVFPGQGSQTLGMSFALSEVFPVVKELYEEAADVLGVDLWALCQEGPIETLNQTENTQPALLTAGVAAWRAWLEAGGDQADFMAGHSLGEYTALCCAGAVSFADAVALVRDRGRYMQEAVPEGQGSMAAILGLDDQVVRDVCQQIAGDEVLQAVNFNAPGQVVIAGHKSAIERSVDAMKEAGARRAMPLSVSIPAHSSLMTPASDRLSERLQSVEIQLPHVPVVHNVNVQIAKSVDDIRQNLVSQLDSPVRWVECVQAMHQQGVESFIESGPGKVLGGMIKRIAKGCDVECIDSPEAITSLTSG